MSVAASPQCPGPAGGSVPKDRFSTHPWTAPIPPPPTAAAATPPPPTLLPRAPAAPAPVAPPPQLLPRPRHLLDMPLPPASLPTSMAVVPAPAAATVDPRQARAADLEPEMHRVEVMPATRAAAATAAQAATSALAAVRGAVHDATEAAPAPPPTCLARQTGPAEAIEDPGCGARRLSHEGCAAFRPRYAAPPPPLPPASPPVAQPQLAASMYAAAANYSAAAAAAAAAAVDRTDAKCLLPSPGELARAAWGPRTACCAGNVSRDDGHDGASPAAAAAAAARTAAAAAATDGSITGGDGEEEDELQPLGSHYPFPAGRTQHARDSLETQPSTPIRQGQDRRCMSSITQPWY